MWFVGLVFSIIITMVLVPVVYSAFVRRSERNKQKALRNGFHFMENIN